MVTAGAPSPDTGRTVLNRVAAPLLAAGGGFLVALSLPPWGFWPLAFVGVALYELSLGAVPAADKRLLHGALFGLGWLSMGMGWMWFLTVPGYVVATLVFAALHGLAALVAPPGRWRVIGRPAAHTLVEALRMAWPFGGVPLATMGISQAGGPLLGLAGVIGVIGLTWVVFQVGVAVVGPSPYVPATVRRSRPSATGAPQGVVALGAVVMLIVLAAVAPAGSPSGRTLTVAAIQGGGEQGTSALEVPSILVTERHLAATATVDPSDDLDLVLWPENTISMPRVRDLADDGTEITRGVPFVGSDINDLVAAEAERLGVPVLVGLTERADVTGRGTAEEFTNAHVVVVPTGEVTDRYDKVRRVPFGEYVPLRGLLEAVGAPVGRVGSAVAGTGPAVLDVPLPDGTEVRAAVAISWEVFFAGRVREGVRLGGEIVFNPTNGASYTGTVLQTQQVASSRLRAAETGRWVVQTAPTGFTAFVSPSGEVIDRTAISERAVVTHTAELRTGLTWYTRLGDGPITAAVIALFALAVWRGGSWRRSVRRPGVRPGVTDRSRA